MPAETPFTITICGLEELPRHADREVSHVLSILDPGHPEPEAFYTYGVHERLEMHFHDIIVDTPGQILPGREHAERILEFGEDLLKVPGAVRHLLVHCHMGISRSTASMALLLAQAQPHLSAEEVLAQLLHIRELAWPNSRLLMLGEELLGRHGEFTAAAVAIYQYQLERRPELEKLFIEHGRALEVEMALRGARG